MFGQITRPPSRMQPDRSNGCTSFAHTEFPPNNKIIAATRAWIAVSAKARDEVQGAALQNIAFSTMPFNVCSVILIRERTANES